jgi:hypothetical protein
MTRERLKRGREVRKIDQISLVPKGPSSGAKPLVGCDENVWERSVFTVQAFANWVEKN